MKQNSRNRGIDLLRIISIFSVVVLHVLGHGGILSSVQSLTEFSIIWFLEIFAYPAVNCFVLISGYVGYREDSYNPRAKNIINLLFVVLFYSILICLLFKMLKPTAVGTKEILTAFVPTITGAYWFFSAYFGLFFCIPILNLFVHKARKKQSFVFFIIFLSFGAVSTLRDPFYIGYGYSVMWFSLLYLVGAIIKKYALADIVQKEIWLLVALSSTIITWLPKATFQWTGNPWLQGYGSVLVSYVSPTVVLAALGWLCFFSKVNCEKLSLPLVSFFSTSAFSVYLIHDNAYVREYLISNIHKVTHGRNVVFLVFFVVCCVTVIFLSCTLIDKFRILLFRWTKLDRLSGKIEEGLKTSIDVLCKKIKASKRGIS